MGTLLGFDYGTAKIGIAVGQTVTGTATPLETLRYRDRKPDWAGIQRLIEVWNPDKLVVGLPCDLDGGATEITEQACRFARQLEGRFRLPVHMMDERLTSMEARSQFGRPPKKLEELDALAARLILETWLSEQIKET